MSFTKSWSREKRRWQKWFLWRTFVAQRSCCCTIVFRWSISAASFKSSLNTNYDTLLSNNQDNWDWKLGLRIVAWSKPGMFCKESVGKIRFRAFLKRVSPWILSLKSVEYFGASEHYWVVKKKRRILIRKIAMVGCCKLSPYANESCDEHAIYFRRWLKWRAMYITFSMSGNDVISLESRSLNFHVFIHMYSLLPQR